MPPFAEPIHVSRSRFSTDLLLLPRPSRLAGLGFGLLALIAACGTPGAPGSVGAPGSAGSAGATPPPPPAEPLAASINQVTPRVGLVDREVEVTITADGTSLGDGAKVTFGAGIKVLSAEARGPALVVRLSIAPDAKLGARDVTITPKDGKALVAKNGFVVAVPLQTKLSAGKAEQGGLVRLDV